MANLFNLDFDAAKTAFKTFISSTDDFKDYNFEGSAANNLLDQFAYFIQTFSFYLNNIANELFISTAQNEDNVLKLANMLNYLPSRKVSSTIAISIARIGSDNIHIPKYSSWSMGSLKLTNLSDIDITTGGTFEIILNEGSVVTETFMSDGTDFQTFELNEKAKIDNDNLFVYVDSPTGTGEYNIGTENWNPVNLLDLNASGNNYYIDYFSKMNIKFDDGRVFNKPSKNDRIRVIYNVTDGDSNNGKTGTVVLDNAVTNAKLIITNPNNNVTINGVDEESIVAIKSRAPMSYSTQGRAITQSDYESLIKTYSGYSNFNTIKIWGGEKEWINSLSYIVNEINGFKKDLGHIYWSTIKSNTYDYLTQSEINAVESFLNKKKILTLFFIFLHPNIIEIAPSVNVKYKSNILPNFASDLISDINTYLDGLEGFGKKFNQSNLDQYVDSQDNVEYMSSSVTTKCQVKSGAELKTNTTTTFTATSGSTTKLVDTSLINKYSTNHFKEYYIHHLTGTNSPQSILCSAYDDSTGTLNFADRLTLTAVGNFTVGGIITGDGVGGTNDGVGVILEIIGNDVWVATTNGTWSSGGGVDNENPFVASETTISNVTVYGAINASDTYNLINFSEYNVIRFNQAITPGSINETISTPSATTTFTATSGSATKLVDINNLKCKYKEGFWDDYVIKTIAGTGSGQTLTITDYEDSNGTLNFASATAPDATTTYRIEGTLADGIKITLADATNFAVGGDITQGGTSTGTGIGIIRKKSGNDIWIETTSGTWISGASEQVDNANPFVASETTISIIDLTDGILLMNGTNIGLVDYTNGWITYTYNFALNNIQFDFAFDSTLALTFDKETFLKYTDLTSITAL